MILKTDIAELIAAAAARVGIRTETLADAALSNAVFTACTQAGQELEPDQLIAAISAYEFDPKAVEAATHDPDAISFSIRSGETDHWAGEFDFLIRGLRDLVIEAKRVTKEMSVLGDLATIFVLVGYAIRTERVGMAA